MFGVVMAAGLAANARAYTVGGKMDMTVVAEYGDPSLAQSPPDAGHPAYYVAYDGGYIEAGDPIAGERPPAAAALARALAAALASQHFLPAVPGTAPSLVLVYHWGRLGRDSFQIRQSPWTLQPNLLARVALVTPKKYESRIEQDLIDHRSPVGGHIPILDVTERDLLQMIADNRYFVVVSAYDYPSVAQRDARLAWRLKLSTPTPGVAMDEALMTLLQGGAAYAGRNLTATQSTRATMAPGGGADGGAPPFEGFAPPPSVGRELNPAYLTELVRRDHALFTGETTDDQRDVRARPAANDGGTAFLPASLAARIRAYAQEKTALQGELAALIERRTPGPDTRAAIDDFNRANAARIARLTAEREAIRDELARLAAANTDARAGKSLAALQQEFAADVRQLAGGAAPGDN